MKPSKKSILIGALLTASIAANLYLAYCIVDQGITLTYQLASFDSEHDRANTLSALLDLKRSNLTTADLKSIAQKNGWSGFTKKTNSPTSELFVVNGVVFRIQKNRVLAVDVKADDL